jgi:hypothetical protein
MSVSGFVLHDASSLDPEALEDGHVPVKPP